MKIFFGILVMIAVPIFISGCNGKGNIKKDSQPVIDTISVPDTGYTGIKQYMSRNYLIKEVTFKNGVRQGLMKSFYQSGKLRQTFWYENGLREDSAKWYYEEGQVFRSTPYRNDTINGMQQQYYRNGRLKARMNYVKGLRTTSLEEFTMEGKLIQGYPDLVVNIKDEYRTKGTYRITLELSDKSTKVRYYRGDFVNGVFDTTLCKKIYTVNGKGILDLKKTGTVKPGYVGVIAEILTNFGNNYLVYHKINYPYNDLN